MANKKNPLLLLLTAAIWGVAFVAQSVGMDYVGPFTFSGLRSIIGALVLIPCIFLLQKVQKEAGEKTGKTVKTEAEGKQERKTLLIGGACCGLFLCVASNLQQIALQYAAVGKAGFLTAFYIVLVPVLGLFFKKKCSPYIWFSVLLALCGLYLLCVKGSFSLEYSDYLLLLSALVFAGHILVIDYFAPMVDGVKMSCVQFFVCGIVSMAAAFLVETPEISQIFAAWMPILYAGVLSCGVAYTLQIIGQKGMNPTVASLILSLESVISVLAGWVLLHQHLSSREIFGCVIIFAAIILAQLPSKKTAVEMKKEQA